MYISIGCHLLGEYFTQIKLDTFSAVKIFKMNCDEKKYPRSCTSYATLTLGGKGYLSGKEASSEALKYFSKGCELGEALGCDSAGKLLIGVQRDKYPNVTLDPKAGIEFLEKGCSIDNETMRFDVQKSCYAVCKTRGYGGPGIEKDIDKAIQAGTRGCDLDHMQSCELVSRFLARAGKNVQAEEYRKKYEEFRRQIQSQAELRMGR